MRNRKRIWLAAAAANFCLADGSSLPAATPATQPAAQSQSARMRADFDLDPSGYPAGVIRSDQYEQSLASRLRDASTELVKRVGPVGSHAGQSLQVAGFALTQAVEPDLTRAWLSLQPHADPRLATDALDVAARALADAEELIRAAKQGPTSDTDSSRIRRLTALLAMEKALLIQADPADALHAAQMADVAMDRVPPRGQPTWNLLIAACLDRTGRKDDAMLRLQLILRQCRSSPEALVAVMVQSRMLARAGNYPAGVALVSEYLQTIPAPVSEQANQSPGEPPVIASTGDTQPATHVAQCSLSLLKANLLKEWADSLGGSTSESDRQTGSRLGDQAAYWQTQAETSGPYLMRLLPLLQSLE